MILARIQVSQNFTSEMRIVTMFMKAFYTKKNEMFMHFSQCIGKDGASVANTKNFCLDDFLSNSRY